MEDSSDKINNIDGEETEKVPVKLEETTNSTGEDNNKEKTDEEARTKEESSTSKNDNDSQNLLEKPSVDNTFKKPVLIIGPRRGAPTKLKTLKQDVQEAFVIDNSQKDDDLRKELLKAIPTVEKSEAADESPKENKIALPYTEPSWSGLPEDSYQLEVLKSGVILETIDLSNKNFHTVGRLPTCDISMAHPTISRYHAIIQYRAIGDEKNGKGLYVYDLGSTHGTFWNGNQIRPKVYVRLHGGHMVKFGCSQRKFIVQAPSEDQEQESEYTVTELKEMRRREIEERERLEKQRLIEEEEKERLRKEKEENEGIDWGMGEDADEETDLTENPYAQSNNEELFLDDPKKTLRGWFEREGLDLQYQTEDKGIGKYLCWVELPIENRLVRAEALVTGKKKEAVVQCALEACRTLDRYGLLRQATHEARKRKAKNWEEEDFYDSDEDNFLDRTGTIEKKREQRMRMAGKLETKAETYDSLLEKHAKVAEKIGKVERIIALQKSKQNEEEDSNVDALDAFMSSLNTSGCNKTEIRKLKMELLNLRKEEMQLLKLINIAKPANLPPLKPYVPNVDLIKKTKDDFKNLKSQFISKKRHKVSSEEIGTMKNDACKNTDNVVAKEESESMEEEDDAAANENSTEDVEEAHQKEHVTVAEIVNEEESKVITSDTEDTEKAEQNISKKKMRNVKRNQQRKEKEISKEYDETEYREDYSMWLPPENQSGDGKTSLNAKYGY